MKILRVISSIDPKNGGPINGLVNSSRLLKERGHVIEVLSLDKGVHWDEAKVYQHYAFASSLGNFCFSSAAKGWLEANVGDYDLVVIHGLWQFHSYAVSKACRKVGVPYVVFVHGMLDPWFGQNSKLKHLKKVIYWNLIEKDVLNNAARVLFTSQEEERLSHQSFGKITMAPKVVAYGSPQPKLNHKLALKAFMNAVPGLEDDRYLLFLSRVHEKKGVDLLIKALGKSENIPDDLKVVVAGPCDDKYLKKLKALADKLGVSRFIIWVGMLEGDEKWGAFIGAQGFILPSHQENFGIVVSEALSTSTPVLITNKVNIWQEIESYGAGMVSDDTTEGVKVMLGEWFSLNEQQRQGMCKRAQTCYQEQFSLKAAVDSLEGVFETILDEEKRLSTVERENVVID